MKSRMLTVNLTLILAIALGCAGCIAPPGPPGIGTTREFTGTYNVSHTTLLNVQNLNGAVEVVTGDQDIAWVNATLYSLYGTGELDRVQISVTTDDVLKVQTLQPVPPARVTVNYQITIPRRLTVSSIESSNGEISVQRAQGIARLATSNGPISVLSFDGDLTVHTSNGAIQIRDVTGNVAASTSNAEIVIQNATQISTADTSNGRILADFLTAQRNATITTSNARIDLRLSPDLNADLILSTSNGQILLTNVPLALQQSDRTSVRGTIGKGGHRLTVTTSNADIGVSMLPAS